MFQQELSVHGKTEIIQAVSGLEMKGGMTDGTGAMSISEEAPEVVGATATADGEIVGGTMIDAATSDTGIARGAGTASVYLKARLQSIDRRRQGR